MLLFTAIITATISVLLLVVVKKTHEHEEDAMTNPEPVRQVYLYDAVLTDRVDEARYIYRVPNKPDTMRLLVETALRHTGHLDAE